MYKRLIGGRIKPILQTVNAYQQVQKTSWCSTPLQIIQDPEQQSFNGGYDPDPDPDPETSIGWQFEFAPYKYGGQLDCFGDVATLDWQNKQCTGYIVENLQKYFYPAFESEIVKQEPSLDGLNLKPVSIYMKTSTFDSLQQAIDQFKLDYCFNIVEFAGCLVNCQSSDNKQYTNTVTQDQDCPLDLTNTQARFINSSGTFYYTLGSDQVYRLLPILRIQ